MYSKKLFGPKFLVLDETLLFRKFENVDSKYSDWFLKLKTRNTQNFEFLKNLASLISSKTMDFSNFYLKVLNK